MIGMKVFKEKFGNSGNRSGMTKLIRPFYSRKIIPKLAVYLLTTSLWQHETALRDNGVRPDRLTEHFMA